MIARTTLIALALTLVTFTGARTALIAQAGAGWVFETVASVVPPSGCNPYVTPTGFGFDPLGRAVAGWQGDWGCGGGTGPVWARKDTGVWGVHLVRDPSQVQQPFGAPADLVVTPDGTPFYLLSAMGGAQIFGSFGWWQVALAELNSNPEGPPQSLTQVIQNSQHCLSGSPSFALGFASAPSIATRLVGTRCSYNGWLWLSAAGPLHGSVIFNDPVGTGGDFSSVDYASGPGGEHHVVYYVDRGSSRGACYNNGTPGHEVRLVAPHPNRGAETSVVVDSANRVHVAVGGAPTCSNAFEGGLLYATSADGGVTWEKTFVDLVSAHNPSIALDADGNPTISYYRYGNDVRLARKIDGRWTTERVKYQTAAASTPKGRLAFDLEHHPSVLFYNTDESVLQIATGPLTGPGLTLSDPGTQLSETGTWVSLPITAVDPDNGNVTFTATCLPTGLAIDPSTGTITGTLSAAPGQLFVPTVVATGADGSTTVVSFTWAVKNEAPVASSSSVSTEQNTPIVIALDASDPDGHPLTVTIVGGPSHGLATVNGEQIVYTPALDYTGPDALEFTVSDGYGGTASAAVDITVTPGNEIDACFAPQSDLQARWRAEGNSVDSVSGRIGTVLGGVSYVPGVRGQAFQFDGTSGRVRAPFVYDNQLYPGSGSMTISAWVKTTSSGPDAPIATKYECGGALCGGGSSYALELSGGRLSAYLRDRHDQVAAVTAPSSIADGQFHHVAMVLDRSGAAPAWEVRLHVDGSVAARTSAASLGPIVDQDGEVEPLTIGGSTRCCGLPEVLFFTGAIDELAIYMRALSDAEIQGIADAPSNPACQIAPPNTAPVAADESATTSEDTPLFNLPLPATDADDDVLTYSIVTQPAHGTVSLAGSLATYTPAADYSGPDSFTFQADDGTAASNIATFTLAVTPVNDAPTISAIADQTTAEDTPVAISFTIDDPDGDALGLQSFSWGSVTPALVRNSGFAFADGGTHWTVTITPEPNQVGTAQLTVGVKDAAGAFSDTRFQLTITPVNDAPVAADGTLTTAEDSPGNGTLAAADVDHDALTFRVVRNGTLGTVVVTDPATGAFTYTPHANAAGTDTIMFRANDGTTDSNVATMTVTITTVNDPPTASDANVSTSEDVPIALPLNGNDVDGDALTFAVTVGPQHGTLTGTLPNVTYLPAANYYGQDSVVYTASSNDLTSAPATISITVVRVRDTAPPTISDPAANRTVLSPANHRMVDVTVSYTVTDARDAAPTCTLTVTSNEPVNGTGDGDTAPDWVILDNHHIQLRAERAGTGGGRVYTIGITCSDADGNTSVKSVTVRVSKNQ